MKGFQGVTLAAEILPYSRQEEMRWWQPERAIASVQNSEILSFIVNQAG